LQVEHRQWVCENPSENHLAVGYQIQPFDAPNLITIPYLVEASTQYDRIVDFQNFNLGLPAEDKDNGLTLEDIERCKVNLLTSPFTTHVLGGDMGLLCRVVIGNYLQTGEFLVVHKEQIPIGKFKVRYRELCAQFRCTAKVLDAQPYVETVMSLQEEDPNLYGAVFVRKEKLEVYDISTREENEEAGKTALRQVSINRNKALDLLMDDIRYQDATGINKPMIRVNASETEGAGGVPWKVFTDQLTDMKRMKKLTDSNDFENVWVKSDAKNDHFHFGLLYAWVAAKLRATVVGGIEPGMMGVSTFKHKTKEDSTVFGGAQAGRRGTGLRRD
jgi:hypothetical protein